MSNKLLGNLLVEYKEITKEQLDKALDIQTKEGGLIGIVLIQQKMIDEQTLIEYLALQAKSNILDIKKDLKNE